MLRMRHDVSMKSMAEAMGISSSYLSGIEYGEKTPGEGLVFRDVNSLYSFKAISLDYKN
jgi:transcriptional regulator with XRE-family HTH domain